MNWMMHETELKREGRKEGIEQGRKEGKREGRKEGEQIGIEKGIQVLIETLNEEGFPISTIQDRMIQKFDIPEEMAKEYIETYLSVDKK